ncbi:MAG: RlmE family RNA methyltransferase [Desulfobulbus sp.]|jgi:23S rRNA (uridine2552-2'-O)-methyltransferase|nr:RlmE family RNA methyltransferase [Desulfobulbus sp.]
MRKIQDYYFKKAKKDHYPARSVYKLEEAQQKCRFFRPGQRVLDLGCHPGSWSLYAAEMVGAKGLVVAVDLQRTDLVVQKADAEINWLCYDVYSDEFVECLQTRWSGFHVVLSDMAPRTTGSQYADHQHSLRLARRVLELSALFLHENGTLYCKVFQGEDFPEFLQECKPLFASVKVVKPKSSRLESREVFVLGRGFRRPA